MLEQKSWIVLGLFGLFNILAGVGVVSGQGGQFTAEAEHAFGQKILFELTAVTDLDLSRATLFFRQADRIEPPQKVVVPLVSSESDPNYFRAEFELDPHSEEVNIVPFAEVEYWWQLASGEGQTILVPTKSFIYDDNRFAWQRVETEPFDFYWTGEGVEVPEAAVSVFESVWPELQSILPVTFVEPVPVYIYPSSSDLRAALNLTNQEFRQEHVDPALNVVLATAVNPNTAEEELSSQLPHAFTHLLLYHSAGADNYHQIPFWFNEGLALSFATESGRKADILSAAVASQTTLPLTELCQPVVEGIQFELAQAQALSLVEFIQNQYGKRALTDLADAFVKGQDCDTAVAAYLDQSLASFEDSWLKRQQPQPDWLQFLSENGLWLLLVAAGFILMGLLVWQPQKR